MGGGFQRQYVRKFAQHIEVSAGEQIQIVGSKSALLDDISTPEGKGTAANGVRTFMKNWLPGPDSNRRPSD
jgi:site-specific DNA recombinase